MRASTRHLPGRGISVIEVRLGADARDVDFSLGLAGPRQARAFCSRVFPPRSPQGDGVSPPCLQSFLTRWSQGDEDLAPVHAVWLEYDLGRESVLPAPVVCAKLRGRVGADWLVGSLFPALHGRALSAAQKRLVTRAVEALPPGAKVLYAFSLLARGGSAVRLELYGLHLDAIPGYLRSLAPERIVRPVDETVRLFAGCERPHLSFDLAEEVAARIGIEGAFARLPHREPRWAELLDRWVGRGLCTPEKRDAVFAWPGWDSPRTAAERWPEEVRRPGTFCARCLSHFKLVSLPEREPQAKAYLLFQFLDKSGV